MIAVRAAGRGYGWWNVGNAWDAWMNSLFNKVGGAHVVSAYHFFFSGGALPQYNKWWQRCAYPTLMLRCKG